MQRWERLAVAQSPGGELALWRRGAEFRIRVGAIDLMGSREHGSEDALGERGCAGLVSGARVLIGGLGMGFTLAAALRALPAGGTLEIAEASPVVVAWNREWLGDLAGRPLDDPRVELFEGDVARRIRGARWDAILLDVDNGPEALSSPENAGLYDETGLILAHAALRPGGRLGVWSVRDDARFTKRLRAVGFEPTVRRVAAWPGSGRQHWLWMATRA
jgi:spermidine synthase